MGQSHSATTIPALFALIKQDNGRYNIQHFLTLIVTWLVARFSFAQLLSKTHPLPSIHAVVSQAQTTAGTRNTHPALYCILFILSPHLPLDNQTQNPSFRNYRALPKAAYLPHLTFALERLSSSVLSLTAWPAATVGDQAWTLWTTAVISTRTLAGLSAYRISVRPCMACLLEAIGSCRVSTGWS